MAGDVLNSVFWPDKLVDCHVVIVLQALPLDNEDAELCIRRLPIAQHAMMPHKDDACHRSMA